MFAHTREGRLTWWISPEAGPNAPAVVAPHRPGVHRLGVGAIAGPAQRLASKMPIQLHLHAYRLQPGAEGSEVQYAVPKSTPETFEPSCAVLPPHPRWRWGLYPLRWLVGGLWGLGQAPMLGLLYGSIFFATGWTWRLTLADLTPARFGLSIALTAVTLLLCPRLTAGLVDGIPRAPVCTSSDAERRAQVRRGGLLGIGAVLVALEMAALYASLMVFALLYTREVPALERLTTEVFSWSNAPLALMLVLLLVLTALGMQALAVVPTFVLHEVDTDLEGALRWSALATRLNSRPLTFWALSAQTLLFVVGGLVPAALWLLAPLLACGSWWAVRDLMPGSTRQLPDKHES